MALRTRIHPQQQFQEITSDRIAPFEPAEREDESKHIKKTLHGYCPHHYTPCFDLAQEGQDTPICIPLRYSCADYENSDDYDSRLAWITAQRENDLKLMQRSDIPEGLAESAKRKACRPNNPGSSCTAIEGLPGDGAQPQQAILVDSGDETEIEERM